MSRMSSTVYQKFAGGGYLGGVKLVRGYSEVRKTKETSAADKTTTPSTPTSAANPDSSAIPGLQLDERQQKLLKRRSAPPSTTGSPHPKGSAEAAAEEAASMLRDVPDREAESESVRKRDESMMQNDYNDRDEENQGRPIEHLILVTHGIGQRLGMRYVSRMCFITVLNHIIGRSLSISLGIAILCAKPSRMFIVDLLIYRLLILRLINFRKRTVGFKYCLFAGDIFLTFPRRVKHEKSKTLVMLTLQKTSIQVLRISPSKEVCSIQFFSL